MASGERTPLIAGNWKMHGSLAESHELVAGIAAGVADVAGARVLLPKSHGRCTAPLARRPL